MKKMLSFLIMFVFLSSTVFAGNIEPDGIELPIEDENYFNAFAFATTQRYEPAGWNCNYQQVIGAKIFKAKAGISLDFVYNLGVACQTNSLVILYKCTDNTASCKFLRKEGQAFKIGNTLPQFKAFIPNQYYKYKCFSCESKTPVPSSSCRGEGESCSFSGSCCGDLNCHVGKCVATKPSCGSISSATVKPQVCSNYNECDSAWGSTDSGYCCIGTCSSGSGSCSDSDGGIDIKQKGVTTDYDGRIYIDYCRSSGSLTEFYCIKGGQFDNKAGAKYLSCAEGFKCVSGECVYQEQEERTVYCLNTYTSPEGQISKVCLSRVNTCDGDDILYNSQSDCFKASDFCESNAECPSGYNCINNLCEKGCLDDTDCLGTRNRCVNGFCIVDGCQTSNDCNDNNKCTRDSCKTALIGGNQCEYEPIPNCDAKFACQNNGDKWIENIEERGGFWCNTIGVGCTITDDSFCQSKWVMISIIIGIFILLIGAFIIVYKKIK